MHRADAEAGGNTLFLKKKSIGQVYSNVKAKTLCCEGETMSRT